jgi:hypothetical protein
MTLVRQSFTGFVLQWRRFSYRCCSIPPWIRRGGASGDEFIKKSHWFVSVLSLTTL